MPIIVVASLMTPLVGLIEDCYRESKVQEDFIIKANRPTTLGYPDLSDDGTLHNTALLMNTLLAG